MDVNGGAQNVSTVVAGSACVWDRRVALGLSANGRGEYCERKTVDFLKQLHQ